jgi:hypothetical protein
MRVRGGGRRRVVCCNNWDEHTVMKLLVHAPSDRVVGCHM